MSRVSRSKAYATGHIKIDYSGQDVGSEGSASLAQHHNSDCSIPPLYALARKRRTEINLGEFFQ